MIEPDLVAGSIRLWRAPEKIEIIIEPAPLTTVDGHVEQVWARLCEANPKLHDGPVLSILDFDVEQGVIRCAQDTYKRFAVQVEEGLDTGVRLLAAKGVITAQASDGSTHVLMIRRHPQTRLYGGMWELGPAGGLDLQDPRAAHLGMEDVLAQLQIELREEAGLEAPLCEPRQVAWFFDTDARSLDIVVMASIQEPIESLAFVRPAWDGAGIHWLDMREVPKWLDLHDGNIRPSTKELFMLLGWIP